MPFQTAARGAVGLRYKATSPDAFHHGERIKFFIVALKRAAGYQTCRVTGHQKIANGDYHSPSRHAHPVSLPQHRPSFREWSVVFGRSAVVPLATVLCRPRNPAVADPSPVRFCRRSTPIAWASMGTHGKRRGGEAPEDSSLSRHAFSPLALVRMVRAPARGSVGWSHMLQKIR